MKALLKRLSEGMSVFMSVFHCACSHSAILARTAACPRPFDPTSPDCPLEPAQFTGLASTGSCIPDFPIFGQIGAPFPLRHSEHAHLLSNIEKLTLPHLGQYVPFLEPNRRFGLSVGTHRDQ